MSFSPPIGQIPVSMLINDLMKRVARANAGRARLFVVIALAAAVLLLSAKVLPPSSQVDLAIRGVTVIDVRAGSAQADQTILIEGDRIALVGPADAVPIPTGVTVIDGKNLFAVPGLADLHVHMEADDLPLFLANGVTLVREMNGSAGALELRNKVRGGELIGPEMYVAGPLLAGTTQSHRHIIIQSVEEARVEVEQEAHAGYDFVKVYDGLSSDVYRAIIAAAQEHDIPVIGHIPEAVGIDSVLRSGQQAIEHVEQIVNATVGHDLDLASIHGIVDRIERAHIAVTPTLAAMEILSDRRSAWFDGLFTRPEMAYTPPSVRGWWDSLRDRDRAGGADHAASGTDTVVVGGSSRWIEFQRALTRGLAEAGVPLLVGTDTPNPLLVPGFSIHHEMAALERAGLARSEILRAATLGAAEHLGIADSAGTIESGMRADIVLVAGNPLEDLAYLSQVRGVVLRGEWLPQADLDEGLAEVAARREPTR